VADITDNNISVDMDVNQNINVYSKGGWYGNATVKMKVSDGELSAYATFPVHVEHKIQPPPPNQPPTLGALPPLQLMESTQLERVFNIRNYTTDPDTPIANITFRIEDITEPRAGVSIDADGGVSVRPDRKWSGMSFVTINASDGQYSAKSSFTVTVTAKPVTTSTENNGALLMASYGLLVLVVVLLLVVTMDIMVRTRRKRPGPPQEHVMPVVAAPKTEPRAPPSKGEVPAIPEGGAKEAPKGPAEAIDERQAAPQEAYGHPAQAPYETAAGAPAVPSVVVAQEGWSGGEPVGQEEPPVSVPEIAPSQEVGQGESAAPPATEVPAGTEALPVAVSPPVQSQPEAVQEPAPEPPAVQEPQAGEGAEPGEGEPQTPVFEMEPSAPSESPSEPAQQLSEKSAASLLAAVQMAKTSANGMEGEEVAEVPSMAASAEAPPSEAPAPQPAPIAPSDELDTQDAAEQPIPGQEDGGGQQAAEDQQSPKPVTRVRCVGCKAAIPVFSAQRPLVVTCPHCGRMGMLK
jgi:hypothetical protein